MFSLCRLFSVVGLRGAVWGCVGLCMVAWGCVRAIWFSGDALGLRWLGVRFFCCLALFVVVRGCVVSGPI